MPRKSPKNINKKSGTPNRAPPAEPATKSAQRAAANAARDSRAAGRAEAVETGRGRQAGDKSKSAEQNRDRAKRATDDGDWPSPAEARDRRVGFRTGNGPADAEPPAEETVVGDGIASEVAEGAASTPPRAPETQGTMTRPRAPGPADASTCAPPAGKWGPLGEIPARELAARIENAVQHLGGDPAYLPSSDTGPNVLCQLIGQEPQQPASDTQPHGRLCSLERRAARLGSQAMLTTG